MADGSKMPISYKYSDQFGPLGLADSFVKRAYEPKDDDTTQYVEMLRDSLGLSVRGPKDSLKICRCLSDFLIAVRFSNSGYIAWPASNSEYSGPPYGSDIMRNVRRALEAKGFLNRNQRPSKSDKVAAVYLVDKSLAPATLNFKCHGLGTLVEVRSPKMKLGGREVGGKSISLKKFRPSVDAIEEEVRAINRCMLAHPLQIWSGQEFAFCYRVFNDARLDIGGRLYGGWQNYNEEERLLSTIDGQAVCEIDFKASYISIVNALVGTGEDLGFDPYARIEFVRKHNDAETAIKMRKLAKLLVAAYISKANKSGALSVELNQFPKGKKEKDESTGETRLIPVREKFDIPKHMHVGDYMADIHKAFPFLRNVSRYRGNIMFIESEIIVKAMLSLAHKGIPAYPVHDCLIVKLSDREAAIEALQFSQQKAIGSVLNMDISYYEEDRPIVKNITSERQFNNVSLPKYQHLSKYDWGLEDGDVLEDY